MQVAAEAGAAESVRAVRFVLASGNRNKLREFGAILAPHRVAAMPAGIALPPEGITSFRENAVAKARALAAALAADPALSAQARREAAGTDSGRPPRLPRRRLRPGGGGAGLGVPASSAPATPAKAPATPPTTPSCCAELARPGRLRSAARASSARWRLCRCRAAAAQSVAAAAEDDPAAQAATGEWWGTITAEPHGGGGFGYDPVFLPEGSDLTVAAAAAGSKDQASHRALAGRALLESDCDEKDGA